jgi:hypothetical protein
VTGPDHYREAEALAESSLNWMGGDWGPEDMTPGERLARKNSDLAKAQVHATLALVASIADPLSYGNRSDEQWTQVFR